MRKKKEGEKDCYIGERLPTNKFHKLKNKFLINLPFQRGLVKECSEFARYYIVFRSDLQTR